MSNKAQLGQGVQLKKGDGASPENFTAVAQLTSVKGPGPKLDTKDVTNLDSGSYKEFIAGLIDPGEVQIDGQYVDGGGFDTLLTALQSRAVVDWQITFPSNVTTKKWSFSGFLTSLDPTYKSEDPITFTAAIKVTGASVLA